MTMENGHDGSCEKLNADNVDAAEAQLSDHKDTGRLSSQGEGACYSEEDDSSCSDESSSGSEITVMSGRRRRSSSSEDTGNGGGSSESSSGGITDEDDNDEDDDDSDERLFDHHPRLGVLPIVSNHQRGGGEDQENSNPNNTGSMGLTCRRRSSHCSGKSDGREEGHDSSLMCHDGVKLSSSSNRSRTLRLRYKRSDDSSEDDVTLLRPRRSARGSRHSKKSHCRTTKRSTQVLIIALFVWIWAQCYYYSYRWKSSLDDVVESYIGFVSWGDGINDRRGRRERRRGGIARRKEGTVVHHTFEEMELLREQRMEEARAALGTAAGDDFPPAPEEYNRDSGGKRIRRSKAAGGRSKNKSRDSRGFSGVERLADGCSDLEWHTYHYPNCNEIHEIDLRREVRHHHQLNNSSRKGREEDFELPWGFVGNGLWRDVFSCDPREEATTAAVSGGVSLPRPPAVLKVMKKEHEYNNRNFERHRRDALVMERLSSSHHLVSIYGYCANTVLTQAISHTLDDVIYARENEEVAKWSPRSGYVTRPTLELWMGTNEDGEPLATRETELGRIHLALGVFRGLRDLHEGDGTTSDKEWLPIVHADLQAKQYLVDSRTGRIYLNDFNRCRFMAKRDYFSNSVNNNTLIPKSVTIESCPIYIPTAPGSARAPEEYDMAPLSEKLDIYSAGNILYGIITGNRPWNDERGKHTKSAIQKGLRPLVNDTIRNAVGTVDAELTRLLDRVYEHDPTRRAGAREVVDELENLLERELRKKKQLQEMVDQAKVGTTERASDGVQS